MRGAKEAITAAAAFAAKDRTESGQATPRLDAEAPTEQADVPQRVVGTWVLSANTSRTITFHTDGTVTASYDDDKRRRWSQEGARVVFTGTRGERVEILFLSDESIRMGKNVWQRAPLSSK